MKIDKDKIDSKIPMLGSVNSTLSDGAIALPSRKMITIAESNAASNEEGMAEVEFDTETKPTT